MTTTKYSLAQYSSKQRLIMPQGLFASRDMIVQMYNTEAAIFYNELEDDLTNVEFYCSQPCFVYLHHGRELYTNSDNTSFELNPEQATFINQGQNLHSDFVNTSGSLKAHLLFFDQDTITKFCNTQTKQVNRPHLKTQTVFSGGPSFKHFFSSIRDLKNQNLNTNAMLQLKLLEFLHLIDLHNPTINLHYLLSKTPSLNPKRNLQRLMLDEGILHLSVSELAQLSGRSASSFSRDFKAIYNTSAKQWLQQKRLTNAKSLLTEKHLSVADIALTMGYSNVSHFIKSFKDRYGLTPKQHQNSSF